MLTYIDCFSGISGDMFLGAMIDLGVPLEVITNSASAVLKSRAEFSVTARREKRGVIKGRRIIVKYKEGTQERDWGTIRKMITQAPLKDNIKKHAITIFELLAKAEAKAHGESVAHVHFHEIGAIDSIVDIVGASACVDWLGIEEMFCSALPLSRGEIKCRHGLIPSPAPATMELLKGFTTYFTDIEEELVTPTGAAILKALVNPQNPMPYMKIKGVGYGVGSREISDRPNVLRIIMGERASPVDSDEAVVVEADIDDMVSQDFEPLMEALFNAGALDVMFIPVHMKKNRPGVLVQALAPKSHLARIAEAMFHNSTTLGLRYHSVERWTLKRKNFVAKTPFGDIHYKKAKLPNGGERITPEYDDIKSIASKAGVSVENVRRAFWKAMGNYQTKARKDDEKEK